MIFKNIKNFFLKERGNKFYRTLDYYIGIPLVFIIGFFRIKRKNIISNIKSIGLLKTAGIGDTIILSAIIRDINYSFPDIKIVLFTGGNNYDAAKIIIDNNIIIEKISFLNIIKSIKILNKYQFDYFIDFDPWPRINALLSFFSNSRVKIGFKTKKQFRHYIYDFTIEHSDKIHEIENYRNLVKFFIKNFKFTPEIKVDINKKFNYAIVHMYAGGINSYLKELDESQYIDLIKNILPFFDKVYLTGSKDDQEKIERIKKILNDKKVVSIAGKIDLKGVIKLIAISKVVISVNTGIMHIAAAIGTPLIALHGPTNPKRWGPLSKNAVIIKSALKCSPCLNLGFEYGCKTNNCMKAINVNEIVNEVKKII
jgi:heptosyltransferase I